MTLNLDFESTHVDQTDNHRNDEGYDRHCRTEPELEGCEGLIVDVDADNLSGVAGAAAGERIDEPKIEMVETVETSM